MIIQDKDEQQYRHQVKMVLRPYHNLTTVNMTMTNENKELEKSFSHLNNDIYDMKKDREVQNDINVDVMLQIINKNDRI